MSYIGNNLNNDVSSRKYEYTAIAGQTRFPATYTKGIDVFKNGLLVSKNLYTATDGVTINLNSGCTAGDIVTVKTYTSVLNIDDLYTIHENSTSNVDYFPTFANETSGPFSTVGISSSKFKFNPSTGLLTTIGINTTDIDASTLTSTDIDASTLTSTDIDASTIDTSTLTVSTSATLPSSTSIGNVSSTEIGYLDGVTSSVQTQLDSKPLITSGTTQPSGKNGDIFINSSNNYIYIYASGWKQVFPAIYS